MRSDTAVTRRSDHPPRRFYDLDHEHPIPRQDEVSAECLSGLKSKVGLLQLKRMRK